MFDCLSSSPGVCLYHLLSWVQWPFLFRLLSSNSSLCPRCWSELLWELWSHCLPRRVLVPVLFQQSHWPDPGSAMRHISVASLAKDSDRNQCSVLWASGLGMQHIGRASLGSVPSTAYPTKDWIDIGVQIGNWNNSTLNSALVLI